MKRLKLVSQIMCFCLVVLLTSCGGGGGGEQPPQEPEPSNNLPARVVGTLPANGEPCSDYDVVPSDDSKVFIDFQWNNAQYANTYELVVMEGNAVVFSDTYSNLEAQVELQRGKTYTWSVTGINETGETVGNTYSFTTPGVQVGNYAPYAAEISIEFNVGAMEMSITWLGSDEDEDALLYDVQVLENTLVLLEEVDYSLESLGPIKFLSGENYFVEVVSKDTAGNFSISNITVQAPD